MTISNKTVFKDYLAVKHSGQTDVRLSKGSRIDVLIKGVNAPDRLITVENQEVSSSRTFKIWNQMVWDLKSYKTQYPDSQVTAELWWILPRNSIANGAARKRLSEYVCMATQINTRSFVTKTVDDRPVNSTYTLEHLEFSSKKEISDYCCEVQKTWQEYGLVRDEDRTALLTLARATWPSVTAVDLDRCVWFTLDGHTEPVTDRWNVLIKQWVSHLHYRWWTTPVIDNLTPVPAVV